MICISNGVKCHLKINHDLADLQQAKVIEIFEMFTTQSVKIVVVDAIFEVTVFSSANFNTRFKNEMFPKNLVLLAHRWSKIQIWMHDTNWNKFEMTPSFLFFSFKIWNWIWVICTCTMVKKLEINNQIFQAIWTAKFIKTLQLCFIKMKQNCKVDLFLEGEWNCVQGIFSSCRDSKSLSFIWRYWKYCVKACREKQPPKEIGSFATLCDTHALFLHFKQNLKWWKILLLFFIYKNHLNILDFPALEEIFGKINLAKEKDQCQVVKSYETFKK